MAELAKTGFNFFAVKHIMKKKAVSFETAFQMEIYN